MLILKVPQHLVVWFKALILSVVVITAFGAAVESRADARLEFAEIAAGSPIEGARFQVFITKDGVAIAAGDGQQSPKPTIIYRQSTAEILFVDQSHHEYTVMTVDWLAKARVKAEQALEETRERADAQAENLSPEAKQKYQQTNSMARFMPLMGGLLGGNSRESVTYTSTGRVSEFNNFSCEQFNEMTGSTLTRIVCLARSENVGLDPQDAQMVEDFLATLARMRIAGVEEFGFKMPEFMMFSDQFTGFPIAVSDLDKNGFVLASIDNAALDNQSLDVPSSYLQTRIPMFGL
ncbi:MAG: hypothetical protein DHS20C01_13730 [marine bacterium B5-7]|nr:MAG: hypothetical protein DHS20C01_13730 [marine bacterium B5-7]